MNTMVTLRRPVSKRGNRREISPERLAALVSTADQLADHGTERMEKVIADDLKALPAGAEPAVDPAAMLGLWLKGRTGGTTQ